jgi:tyrosyl-tRNA synthetase
VLLAQEIVERFHGASAAAVQALADFDARFRQGAIPDDIPEVSLSGSDRR